MVGWLDYLNLHLQTASQVREDQLSLLYSAIVKTIENDKTIFTFGNGGSAATANHFSADLSLLRTRTGKKCRSINLNSDLSFATALSNDYSYELVIAEQLQVLAKKEDLVIAFSASGNSRNLLEAFKVSNEIGLHSWAVVGFDGGIIGSLANVNIVHFESPKDYGLIENLHMCLNHFIVDRLIDKYRK